MKGCLVDVFLTIITGGLWIVIKVVMNKHDKSSEKKQQQEFENQRELMREQARLENRRPRDY